MRNPLSLPRIIAVIAALCAITAFFLPFVVMDDPGPLLESMKDVKPFKGSDYTFADMVDLSLFDYDRICYEAGNEFLRGEADRVIYLVVLTSIAGGAVLTLLAALGRKPVLMLLTDLLMGGAFYLLDWDLGGGVNLANMKRSWGVAHALYYPLAALIALCAIWMFIAKRRQKQAEAALLSKH